MQIGDLPDVPCRRTARSFVWKVPVDDSIVHTAGHKLTNAALQSGHAAAVRASPVSSSPPTRRGNLVAQRYLAVIEAVVQRSRK
ncbi:MAG: hypothetical protein KF726_05160 [Anaerolineae bacterium]|nr:hypothetical protein [Anaerolineae bacterium]